MLMAVDKGNLEQVRDAVIAQTEPAPLSLREQQRFPYKGWYAVIVRAQREQDAADGFRRANVSAYWPNFERLIPAGHRRRYARFSPIFPGMIFSPVADLNLFWMAVQRITYVLNVVRKEGGLPAMLSNADIEKIRNIEAGENNPPEVKPIHNFKVGQKVRFTDESPVQWPPGKIIELAADGRITVEVYLMMRFVPIKGVLPHQIEAM
jgi:transcription antitermination factor NusG